jgi:two-component system response regulator FixJ
MSGNKIVILVADDDLAVGDALKFSLRLEGYEVHVCRDGHSLLKHPALGACDCILLDHKMPGMTGLDVLANLSARGIGTPVIFMTGPLSEDLKRHALKAGARLVLEKPLLDGILTDRIRELLRAG